MTIGKSMTGIMQRLQNHLQQYGVVATVRHALRMFFRGVYRSECNVVFVIPGFFGREFHDPCIKPLTKERIERAADGGELNLAEVQLLTRFLDEGSKGIFAEIDGKLAGYAWVQYKGEYRFGRSGRMTIPSEYVFVKNLYVRPVFRGLKLGQKLNAARLSLIPSGCIPVVFIIPENRFAIRNWEKYGFERVLEAKQSRWFRGSWRIRIARLSSCAEADTLLQTLEEANRR